MDSNTHSTQPPGPDRPDGLAALAAVVDGLAAQDLDGLPDTVRAERVLVLRRLVDRLEGQWLKELAAVDARGAAGAEQGPAGGLDRRRGCGDRLRLGAGAASQRGADRPGPVPRPPDRRPPRPWPTGRSRPPTPRCWPTAPTTCPTTSTAEAEPVLVEAARRLDPPRLRRVLGHLRQVADPDGADRDQAERRHGRRGLWLAPTFEGMVAVDGLLEPEAGQTLLAALEPLARPADAEDARSGGQRRADALTELARRNLEGGRLPQTGGVRPQLTVTVDLDSLLGHPGAAGR